MTNPTGGEWQQSANIVYSEQGVICALSEPRATEYIEYYPLETSSKDWDEAIANGKLIIDAVKAYRYLLEKYGPDWKDKI